MSADNLGFWKTGNVVQRSCAINSMAHEMSHLIGRLDGSRFETVFLDSAAGSACKKPSKPDAQAIASYLIGTVAQCLWLEKQGRLAADSSKGRNSGATFADCVVVFGQLNFNRARCWSFSDSDPIRERVGIPCPVCAPWSCSITSSGAKLDPPHQPPCEQGSTTPTSQFRFVGNSGECELK